MEKLVFLSPFYRKENEGGEKSSQLQIRGTVSKHQHQTDLFFLIIIPIFLYCAPLDNLLPELIGCLLNE